MVHLTDKNSFDIGERQIHLSAPWINPDISCGRIRSSVIKSAFLLEGQKGTLERREGNSTGCGKLCTCS